MTIECCPEENQILAAVRSGRWSDEMLRHLGVTSSGLMAESGLIWVVLDMQLAFRRAARLDDELMVTCELLWTKGVRQGFRQEITRRPDGARIDKVLKNG